MPDGQEFDLESSYPDNNQPRLASKRARGRKKSREESSDEEDQSSETSKPSGWLASKNVRGRKKRDAHRSKKERVVPPTDYGKGKKSGRIRKPMNSHRNKYEE